MVLASSVQWLAFGVFAFIAVAGALGMTTTMSMFRSGIFLMASFIGVAGLFILLLADLIALLQIMMYIGGMLVMILFMLLFSHDPGGAMMSTHMKLEGPERWFSFGLARKQRESHQAGGQRNDAEPQSSAVDHHGDGHAKSGGGDEASSDGPTEGGGGDSGGRMSMYTPIKRPAAIVAVLIGGLLVALLISRPHWPVVHALPDENSPEQIGRLLMGKYMIAFEGAGLLILLGIFGAVLLQHPGWRPGPVGRDRLQAAVDETPPPIQTEPLEPQILDLREHER